MVNDKLEFYHDHNLVVSVPSSMIPAIDSLISIGMIGAKREIWKVIGVTFAVDDASGAYQRRIMRCNVNIIPAFD